MCLAVPLKVIEIHEKQAVGELNGVKKNIRIDLLPQVEVGQYVMVHAGFAIEIMKEKQAKETIETILELQEAIREITPRYTPNRE